MLADAKHAEPASSASLSAAGAARHSLGATILQIKWCFVDLIRRFQIRLPI